MRLSVVAVLLLLASLVPVAISVMAPSASSSSQSRRGTAPLPQGRETAPRESAARDDRENVSVELPVEGEEYPDPNAPKLRLSPKVS